MFIWKNRIAGIVVLAVIFIECGPDAFAGFGARGPNGPNIPLTDIEVVSFQNRITVSGFTDEAIQAACNQAAAQGVPVVYLPAGSYEFDNTVNVPAGLTILGSGVFCLCESTTSSVHLFRTSGDNVRFTRMRLVGHNMGTSTDNNTYGIVVSGYRNVRIDHCEMRGFSYANTFSGESTVMLDHCEIHHNLRDGLGYGLAIYSGAKVLISDNEFEQCRHSLASNGALNWTPIDGVYYHAEGVDRTHWEFLYNDVGSNDQSVYELCAVDTHPGMDGTFVVKNNHFDDLRHAIGIRDGAGVIHDNLFSDPDGKSWRPWIGVSISYGTHNGIPVDKCMPHDIDVADNTFVNIPPYNYTRYSIGTAENIFIDGELVPGTESANEHILSSYNMPLLEVGADGKFRLRRNLDRRTPVQSDCGFADRVLDSTGMDWASGLHIGASGSPGVMTIQNGDNVSSRNGYIGFDSGFVGAVSVSGNGSTWTNAASFFVGDSGTGSLYIGNGGNVSNHNGYIAYGFDSVGEATVTGNNSTWINTGDLYIGVSGTGTLNVQNGGSVFCGGSGYLGYYKGFVFQYDYVTVSEDDAEGTVTVNGAGSNCIIAQNLYIGGYDTGAGGMGSIIVENNGQLGVGWVLNVWSTGTMNIGATGQVTVGGALVLVQDSTLTADAGATIHMTGSVFQNESTNSANLAGLGNLTMIFEGGTGDVDPFEAGGEDVGATIGGFVEANFLLGTLQLGGSAAGRIQLVDEFDNQDDGSGVGEAVYVHTLIMNAGATIDTNGLNLYYLNDGDPKQFFRGDADLDGDVDAADYGTWQAGFGETTAGTWATGDFDGDGNVDATDYGIWQASFGSATSGGTTVPEPITLTLLGLGGLGALIRRRRV